MWRMNRLPDVRLTCLSNYPVATYSGMLPGVLAGQYPVDRMEIDLVRLCASSGVRLIVDSLTGVDVESRELHFRDRPTLRFDVLSVGVGSSPNRDGLPADADNVIPIKPMQSFLDRLEHSVTSIGARIDRPLTIAIVGGGVGGVEIAACLPSRLDQWLDAKPHTTTLITSGGLGTGLSSRTTRLLQRQFELRHVRLEVGRRVERIEEGKVVYDDGQRGTFDLIIWATSAVAPAVLTLFDLPKDDRGFLKINHTLRTTRPDTPIFAVGDSGTIVGEDLPKAGVYAVRQSPILWENIARSLAGQPLQSYRPQRRFLKLINSGDGQAIGEYGPLSVRSRWMWKLKDWIDSRFMDKYQTYAEPMMEAMEVPNDVAMRCAGCGGKVGPSVLSKALSRLALKDSPSVQVGLDDPDDVALLELRGNGMTAATVDFFSAPFDDPYLVGRIAALNSASDMFASGAAPQAALTVATLPVGHPRAQEQMMCELMAGGVEELDRMGAALVGGHTIEGPQMSIGYAMLGRIGGEQKAVLKSGIQVGDLLVLTKPIGVGVLLAAHMRAECQARWWNPLMMTLLASNQAAAEVCYRNEVSALTDVTGFGLAGHLLEMLKGSQVSAELWLDDLPTLDGAEELVDLGVESTLAPANRAAETSVRVSEVLRLSNRYALLFDPQTSGGLIASTSEANVASLLSSLKNVGVSAVIVGRAIERDGQTELRVIASHSGLS